MPNPQAPAHWSKDFVEHLRTVHFALIAISAGLILLVFSSKQYNAVIALVQIEEILNLKKQWSLEWIAEYANHRPFYSTPDKVYLAHGIDPEKMDHEGEYVGVPLPGARIPIRYAQLHAHRAILLSCRLPKHNWFMVPSRKATWTPASFPGSLGDFEQWWTTLDQGNPLYVPSILYSYWEHGPNPEDLPTDKTIDVDLTMLTPVGAPEPDYVKYYGEFTNNHINHSIGLFVDSYHVYDLRQTSVNSAFRSLQPGSFKQTFKDLSIAAHDESDLPLEDIKEFLHDEAAKGPEVFEAFGMKFPAGQITFWGVVLLLSIQLYFLVYLRQLFGRLRQDDAGWDVPWIGMDSSQLSKTILYTSLVILPLFASTLLGWQATVRLSSGYWDKIERWYYPIQFRSWPWHWHYTVLLKIFLLVLSAIVSGYLGLLSWKYRPQIAPEPELPEYPDGLSKKWMQSR
jgi:hypothetical protein